VIEERRQVGVSRTMFATDFPYIENEFPNTRPIIDKIYASAGSGRIIASNSSSSARPPDPWRIGRMGCTTYGFCQFAEPSPWH
jgi:hypothetical protein